MKQVSGPGVTLSDPAAALPTFTAPPVNATTVLEFELIVSDGALPSAPARAKVTVLNTEQPLACDAAVASPSRLWPPNHKLIPVTIKGVTDPENRRVVVTVTGVTQDEPVGGLSSGHPWWPLHWWTSPDAVIAFGAALLRAERIDDGNGRVYRVSFVAKAGTGRSCRGAVTVGVPHDLKPGSVAIDDGQRYDSTRR